jgi:hypothetical protein
MELLAGNRQVLTIRDIFHCLGMEGLVELNEEIRECVYRNGALLDPQHGVPVKDRGSDNGTALRTMLAALER